MYSWNGYRCAYELIEGQGTPLLLIHPIGVGLSRRFWQRFIQTWRHSGKQNPIYNPDLLGCGESDLPHVAYSPTDWAKQLQSFLQTVIKTPVILVVQGALLPIAIELVTLEPDLICALVSSGPPAIPLISRETSHLQHRIAWNLFDSPLGQGFYRYARRSQFLRRFSMRQLFERAEKVDSEWLAMLKQGSQNLESRHAVFSFLSGFWRQNYLEEMMQIRQPVFVVFGEKASSISREGKQETADDRLTDYLKIFPNVEGVKIPGCNVMPYETTDDFVSAIVPFITRF
jgi:pimeloyl-ACP methyl ester carboxylesterase